MGVGKLGIAIFIGAFLNNLTLYVDIVEMISLARDMNPWSISRTINFPVFVTDSKIFFYPKG